MKNVKFLSGIFVIGIVAIIYVYASTGQPVKSTLVAVPEVVDVGTVTHGLVGNAAFRLENKWDKSIHLTDIIPSCGCTLVSSDTKDIPPHGVASGVRQI